MYVGVATILLSVSAPATPVSGVSADSVSCRQFPPHPPQLCNV